MTAKQGQAKQAHQYRLERMRAIQRTIISRRRVLERGTRLAFAGSGGLTALLAACGGSKTSRSANVSQPTRAASSGAGSAGSSTPSNAAGSVTAAAGTQAGAYSPYPLVDKYNWRRLNWGGKPTIGGEIHQPMLPFGDWNLMTANIITPATPYFNGLYYFLLDHAVNDADLDGQAYAPDLAQSTEHTPDYMTWTFKLPPNVYFHDLAPVNGRQLTADDVVFSYERYIDTSVWSTPLEFIDKISAPDAQTVRMDLKYPFLPVPQVLATPYYLIFAKEHFTGDQDRWKQQPIGTGPFMVTGYQPRQLVQAQRHPRYWQKDQNGVQLPYADKLISRQYSDSNSANAAFRSGDVDLDLSVNTVDEFQNLVKVPDSYWVVQPAYVASLNYIIFQWNNPLFKDVRVRRALSLALDRKAIVQNALGGAGIAPTPIPFDQMGLKVAPGFDYLPADGQFNPQEAKQLLAEAGHPQGFKTTLIFGSFGTPLSPAYYAVQKAWHDVLGVDVEFQQLDYVTAQTTMLKKSFSDLAVPSNIVATDPYTYARALYYPGAAQNWGSVDDPDITQLIDQLKTSTNVDQIHQLAMQINTKLFDDAVWIAGYHSYEGGRSWVHTLAQSAYTGIYNWGGTTWRHIWIDEHAPNGRGGKAS